MTHPVISRVCGSIEAVFNVSERELLGPRKSRRIAEARHVAFCMVRGSTRWSLTDIGAAFNRDHTSVCYGLRAARHHYATDEAFKRIIDTMLPSALDGMQDHDTAAAYMQRKREHYVRYMRRESRRQELAYAIG